MSEAVRRRARAAVDGRREQACIEPSPPTKTPDGCGTAATNTARSTLLCLAGVLTAVAVPTALLALREAARLRNDKQLLEDQLWEERAARAVAERRHARYTELQRRTDNLPWQERLQSERKLREQHENSDEFINALFDDPSRRFPDGANLSEWEAVLRTQTPSRFDAAGEGKEGGDADKAPAFCHELHGVVISERELNEPELSDAARARALRALTECGCVSLDLPTHLQPSPPPPLPASTPTQPPPLAQPPLLPNLRRYPPPPYPPAPLPRQFPPSTPSLYPLPLPANLNLVDTCLHITLKHLQIRLPRQPRAKGARGAAARGLHGLPPDG